MNKKTFFLILCGLGLILWTVSFFFGFNYTQSGALMVSIPVSLFVFVLIGGMIYLMKRYCNPNGVDNYRVAKNTERAALVIYIIASLCTAVYIGHFVSVSMNTKSDIQSKVKEEFAELERIFDRDSIDHVYTTPMDGSYMEWVEKQEKNLTNTLKAKGDSSSTIIIRRSELRNKLVGESGFYELQRSVQDFLDELDNSVLTWNWLNVAEKISLLEAKKEEWKKAPEEFSKQSEYTKNEPYRSNSTVNYENISSPLTKLSASDISISAIILIIVLQIMMLLSYISDRPNTGRDPIKYKNNDFVRSYEAKKKPRASSSHTSRHENRGDEQNHSDFVINIDDEE